MFPLSTETNDFTHSLCKLIDAFLGWFQSVVKEGWILLEGVIVGLSQEPGTIGRIQPVNEIICKIFI